MPPSPKMGSSTMAQVLALTAARSAFDVVLPNKGHVFEHRLKTLAVLFLAGKGHGPEGSAMIRTLERHQLGLGIAARLVPGETRQLDGAFHRLGAAVREEGAIEARNLAQALGQLSLVFVVIKIRNVNHPRRLLADGLHDARMSMAQRVYSEPGHEVEILLAFEVVEKDTFAALKGNGITVVGGEKKALFNIGDLIEAGHGLIVKRTMEDGLGRDSACRVFSGQRSIFTLRPEPSEFLGAFLDPTRPPS